ncbi:MAG TPA: ProQ/FinO family protein [Xanthobacteraceae bacterium]|nr:ProQ/FinO family protein [Xanthobacteraceae bacterium]
MKKQINAAHRKMLWVRRLLHRDFPKAFMGFGEPKVPLAIGVRDALEVHYHLKFGHPFTVGRAVADYCDGKRYLAACQPGAVRIDLEGNAVGVVTDAEAEYAAAKLANIEATERAKADAETAARAEAEAKAKAEAARRAAAQHKAIQPHPAPRQYRKVEVEVIRRRPGVPGVTRRFG